MRKILYLVSILTLVGCIESRSHVKVESFNQEEKTEIKTLIMPAIPMAIIDIAERRSYLSQHYWDSLVFAPISSNEDTINMEQYFSNYLVILKELDEGAVKANIKKSLSLIVEDSLYLSMFNYLSDKYLYDPNSPFRNDELYLAFVDLFIGNPKLSFAENERLKFKYSLLLKNRVGHKAENFSINTQAGKMSLYNIDAEYILLYFNNPGCSACAEVQSMLIQSERISKMQDAGKIKLLSLYSEEDQEEWEKHKNEQPKQWLKGCDADGIIKKAQLYDLKAIPTIYLLDKDKKVVLKDATVQQLESYIYDYM